MSKRPRSEALPGGGVGYLFPCSPEINWLVSPKSKICFLMFPVPQYFLCSPVPLKIWPLFPCSPEINTIFPCSPKSLGEPQKCMRHAMIPKYILTPNVGFLPQIIYRYALGSTLLESNQRSRSQ